MRHIICQSFVSLDGVINHMDRWHFDYTDAEAEAIALEQLRASAGLLMGRGTYEVYAATWPGRTGTYPELINRLPKYVVSSTLGEATWNNTRIISAAPAQAIRALKEEDGPQLLMHGYGPLAKMLLAEGAPGRVAAVGASGVGRRRFRGRSAAARGAESGAPVRAGQAARLRGGRHPGVPQSGVGTGGWLTVPIR